jgi:hypothetical protein
LRGGSRPVMAVMKVRVKATAFTKMKQKERLGKERKKKGKSA